MEKIDWTILIPLITAIVLSIPGWIGFFTGRKKTHAESHNADAQASNSYAQAAITYSKELKAVRNDYTKTQNDLNKLLNENTSLKKAMLKAQTDLEVAQRLLDSIQIDLSNTKALLDLATIRIDTLEREKAEALDGIRLLCQQVIKLGSQPVYPPEGA